jgi:amino acid transporter
MHAHGLVLREDGDTERQDSQPDRGGSAEPGEPVQSTIRGRRPGDRYVRVVRSSDLPNVQQERYVKLKEPTEPQTRLGREYQRLRRVLIGRPLESAESANERLSKIKALPILSSDALSSVAYGTEALMTILVLAGIAAISFTIPVSIAVLVVLFTVVISYSQVIKGYPQGGGSYAVASENLGRIPGLVAAASLMIDYTLTVAVSTAAGIAAMTSAFPSLFPYRVELAVLAIAIMTVGNLRGIREAGTIFAAPTYIFIISIFGVIAIGLWKFTNGALPAFSPPSDWVTSYHGVQAVSLFLLLRAFSSGLSALTGMEAISNSVPVFQPPAIRNARVTLFWMGAILAVLFSGISFLATHMAVIPDPNEQVTVLSLVTRLLVGEGWYFYLVQFATMLILVLAANTSFAGFPRLAAILAQDRYFPHQFLFRGERLAFTTGIIVLAVLAALLEVIFRGSVDALIPLYAVGVFTAFTLAQSGMVVHWWRSRERGWRNSMVINGLRAAMTGVAPIVIAVSKFLSGAWIVMVLVPVIIWQLLKIRRHYDNVASQLRVDAEKVKNRPVTWAQGSTVVVPIDSLNQAAVRAIDYAQGISNDVTVVHVAYDPEDAELLRQRWGEAGMRLPLVLIESPYRELVGPLVNYIEQLHGQRDTATMTVVVPEFVPAHLYEVPLHNQTAWRLRTTLWTHPGIVVTSVPYHLMK